MKPGAARGRGYCGPWIEYANLVPHAARCKRSMKTTVYDRWQRRDKDAGVCKSRQLITANLTFKK
jgi:hypothetical protein